MNHEEARAAGYRVGRHRNPQATVIQLCRRLGEDYHLALIDGGNVIHRVIGNGWDVEIYPMSKRCRKFCVVLWENYGGHLVVSKEDISLEDVRETVETLMHEYIPGEHGG